MLVGAIALPSVQNATPLPITFLGSTTVARPVGIGMIGTGLLSVFGFGRKGGAIAYC